MLFDGLDHLSQLTDGQEGESTVARPADAKTDQHPLLMIGSVPISISTCEADSAHITAQQRGQQQ
jgi:hypothetical protein